MADNIAIVIPAVGASAASKIRVEPAAYDPSPPAAKMVGASPDTKLREGNVARDESAAAAIAVAESAASDVDGSADARGGPALGRGTDARGDLPAAAGNVAIVIPAVGASAASEIGVDPAA